MQPVFKMRIRQKWPLVLVYLFILLVISAPFPATAQAWPTKPLRIIISVAIGTAPDLVTRLLADSLSKSLGRSVVVENAAGGAGQIAAQAAVRAAPDGYSYFLAGLNHIAIDRHLFKTLPYDMDKELVPVARVYDSGALTIAITPDLPAKNLAEFIALAKKFPGKMIYGADGSLSPIIGNYFTRVTDTDFVAVNYKGPGSMLQDASQGRIQAAIISLATVEPYRKDGRLRVLAVGTAKRFPGLDEVPTMSETIPGFRAGGTGILMTQAPVPAAIVARMRREMDPIIRSSEYQQRLLTFGFTSSDAGTPESIAEFIRGERELWEKIVKTVGITRQ
jgi:tripartite-type tricarboxylate transporter receptor subunit TctC